MGQQCRICCGLPMSIVIGKPLELKLFAFAVLVGSLSAMPVVLAQSPAQPNKVLHVAFEAADDGFDMIKTYNLYSGSVAEVIFEPLLKYDYLARPVVLVPNTAQAMPTVEQQGKVYRFKIRPGIYFTPDPAFKGKRRELIAQDYIYAIQRISDPQNHAPSYSFVEGKIVGLQQVVDAAKKTGKFDYAAPIAGLKALDRYTLQISLTRADYNFPYILAYVSFAGVAREVVDYYGDRLAQHPVGTGPYRLSKYLPRSKIELQANPDYRGFVWDFKSSGSAADRQLVAAMHGKPMPQIGKVEISIIEEGQSRWLAFKSGQLDYDKLTANAVPQALNGQQLTPALQRAGIQLFQNQEPEISYTAFNMRDPIVGGFSLDKIALRRAISLSYNQAEAIQILYKGQARKAEMFIPEGVQGHDRQYRSSIGYNPRLANKLLDRFGYRKGPDGYRRLPNGQPLTLKFNSQSSSDDVVQAELWKKFLDAIGLRSEFKVSNFADNMKQAMQCKYMIWSSAWIADYPEGENFAQLLYGANAGRGNLSCYQSQAYDALYRQAMALPAAQRQPLYNRMSRQIEADNPWIVHRSRLRSWLIHPNVQGFKAHPLINSLWPYLDIQPEKK
jgi:oligopeptide transport system substrate-binding protein